MISEQMCLYERIPCYVCVVWLRWVFIAARRLSLVAVSSTWTFSVCTHGLLAVTPLIIELGFQGMWASAVVAHGPHSCDSQALECRLQQLWRMGFSSSMACGIFLDQESNPYRPHWQVDSYPLQGSPTNIFQELKSYQDFPGGPVVKTPHVSLQQVWV